MSCIRGLVIFIWVAACLCTGEARAQLQTNTPGSFNNPRDTSADKTNDQHWKDERAVIWYHHLHTPKKHFPDSSIHSFHRRPFSQPWHRDLGNMGSASRSLLFAPEYRVGPTLGYRAYDVYRNEVDSLPYYNTTRPYSIFNYQLGSKLEQVSRLLHSQNINPYWNVTAQYQKINSRGFYKSQRNNDDNVFLSTHYRSKKQHYELHGGVVYNKMQQDENGGITSLSYLEDDSYGDRRVIPVAFENAGYSTTRSPVTNMLRDYSVFLNHSYTVGREDTVYSADSTSFSYRLIPRFRITHRFELRNDKHVYNDVRPDSLRYTGLLERAFFTNDSVYARQHWTKVENRILLNSFFGKPGKQVAFTAGVGNRYDRFQSRYITGTDNENIISNFIVGELRKEVLEKGQWGFNASTQFYFTGSSAGDFLLNVSAVKDFKGLGSITAGVQQQLQSNPYNYSIYANQYVQYQWSFGKESISQLYLVLNSDRLHLSAGLRNYVVANMIYLNQQQLPDQYSGTFNLTQVWLRKLFHFGNFTFDNEVAFQQKTGGAPVNVPTLLGRHQLALETYMFKRALKVAVGLEARYHTDYESAGYSPFFNRYYYQDAVTLSNTPEGTFFFNFKIKQFRASLSLDQLQQLFYNNLITTPGWYPAQDFMLRFGFAWELIN